MLAVVFSGVRGAEVIPTGELTFGQVRFGRQPLFGSASGRIQQ
jgi:hypothetical protein